MSNDELLDAYAFILYELNDAIKLNDNEGVRFYTVHKKIVMKQISDRNIGAVVSVVN